MYPSSNPTTTPDGRSNVPTVIGLHSHWGQIRRHASCDALAVKAKDYILQMLQQEQNRR